MKRKRGEGWSGGGGQRPLGFYLDIRAGVPEFLVTPLLMGPVCLLSQGRFEEPFRSCIYTSLISLVNGGSVGREEREESEGQSHREEEREGGSGTG